VCLSLDAKGKNTTKCNNNIFEVFQLEHPPLASNRGTHLHTEKSRREWGGLREERGLKYDMKSELKYTFYKFTSWTKCPLRGSMQGQISNMTPIAVFNKALFRAHLGVPLRSAEGYRLAGDRQYSK
jgi:hypothetical protein